MLTMVIFVHFIVDLNFGCFFPLILIKFVNDDDFSTSNRGGGLCTSMTRIAMLAGVFKPKPDRLKDRGQTK